MYRLMSYKQFTHSYKYLFKLLGSLLKMLEYNH